MLRVVFIAIVLLNSWNVPVKAAEATISSRDCQRLVRHQARGDVTYKPGVDVRGKKVKPADAGGDSTFKLPKEYSFNIGVDIAAKYGLDAKNISSEMVTGKVTVIGSRVYMNGKPVTTEDQAGLATKCRSLLSRR